MEVGCLLCRFVSFRFVSFFFIHGLAVSMILDFRFRSSLFLVLSRLVSFRLFDVVVVEALLLSPGFCTPMGALLCSSEFHPPRETGAASMMPLSPAGYSLGFFPPREAGASDVAALASGLFLGVSSPKGSWVGVDDVTLASG